MAGPRWLFDSEQLNNTPSIRNGFTKEVESKIRQKAATLIQNMGQKMQLSQLCMNTAIVYMHRFYMIQTMQRFPYEKMASAFIFLAAKVEEQPKKIEHVIRTYYYVRNRNHPVEVDVRSQDYLEKVQELVINENILLQTLGFNVTIDHSNTHVVKLCQLVKAPKQLSQSSYFLSTNSLLLTNLCLKYNPKMIAATCIHLACKWDDWELPRSKEGKDWWTYLVPTLSAEQLEDTSKKFLSVMEKADPAIKDQLLAQLKMSAESSPNSRSASPAPYSTGRSSQHGTPHRVGSTNLHPAHAHNTYTPERGHTSKTALPPSTKTALPAKTYAEHRSRLAVPGESNSGKPRPHHVESPLARPDLKRPHPKDTHVPSTHLPSSHMPSSHNSSNNKQYDMLAHQPPPPTNNPYAKQSRNHESSKSRHHHRHYTGGSSMDQSPMKKAKTGGENGNGEQQNPPLPTLPQPKPPLPPPP